MLIRLYKATLTDAVSHAGRPIFLSAASAASRWYTDEMLCGAGTVLGLACAALISAFSDWDSFDIVAAH